MFPAWGMPEIDSLGLHNQLTFFTTLNIGRALWLFSLSALLFVLPGMLLVVWFIRDGQRSVGAWFEKLILAGGLSVAMNALLVYATLTGLRLSPLAVVGYLVLCSIGILARWVLDQRARVWRFVDWSAIGQALRRRSTCPSLVRQLPIVSLLGVALLVSAVRIYAVRDVAVPMWGDSYQHTMMAQLIVDNGGLFDSWEPYVPLQTFTYHFGLHANIALWSWLTRIGGPGLPVYRATLWVGQLLNVLAVLGLYPLALKVSRSRWAGVVAVWMAGLWLPMPMYYVNWGRYTQLGGQVILTAAVVLTWSLLQSRSSAQANDAHKRFQERPSGLGGGQWGVVHNFGQLLPAWVAVAGLALTHYRVLIFFGVFVVAWLLFERGRGWRRAIWLGAGALAIVLPWFIHTLSGKIVDIVAQQLTTAPARLSSFSVQYNAVGNLSTYMAPPVWLLLPVAVALGLWQRRRGVGIVSLWWFLLFVATNPELLRLPGSGTITNFALFIALYIPVGILIGDLVGWAADRIRPHAWTSALLFVLLMVGGLGGAYLRLGDLRVQQHALALSQDVEAMAWIRENTPQDARFLVNSFFAYGDSVIVGSDGGWWMPLLGGRTNTVPPLNYSAEHGPWPEYRLWVNELTALIQERGIDDPATIKELRERGITHVYIGQQQGRVNYGGPHVLSPQVLGDSQSYRPIYHQDQVWVFELAGD